MEKGDIEGGPIILSHEDSHLVELMTGFNDPYDFARVVFQLTPAARDELRAAIGTLQAVDSYPTPTWTMRVTKPDGQV